ncbi:NAD(P)-binding protein [Streptomyces mangrovisoli]|uniref:Portal protein n=1 Tax=Streptomyces mangrovisoli TaxID=1428628 RepID=A0A1J4P003_9ACTN|nr:NAD(P)-binding protein [Streptomyces mangrovisoli]OIJ68071.1 portal protein [Streptomyces mangrovisoli]
MTTSTVPPSDQRAGHWIVIGDTRLAARVCAALRSGADDVRHLPRPGDRELRSALGRPVVGAAVLLHDDVSALRYALAVAHLAPDLPLVATVFDRTVADELSRLLPQCHVTSPAELAAPSLAGPCLDASLVAARRQGRVVQAVREAGEVLRVEEFPAPRRTPPLRGLGRAVLQLRSHDAGTRLLVLGALALAAVLAADWAWSTAHGRHPAEAFFDAARVVAGVGPADAPADAHGYQLMAALAMLSTVVFTALLTAGVVERMLGPRLIGLVGTRTLPRSGHVIVVGMGQVGMRLCVELRALGVPVVGVERDPRAAAARLARTLGIPVVDGHGGDRHVLERLRLHRARALAAVGSDDLDNVAVALAAHGIAPGARVVIRAGEHDAITETRSLLPMGVVRDITGVAARYVVARLRAQPVGEVVTHRGEIHVRDAHGAWLRSDLTGHDRCVHGAAIGGGST